MYDVKIKKCILYIHMYRYLIVTFLQEILDWSFVQGMPLGMPMALISTGGGTVVTLDLGSQFSLANSYKEVSFATPKIASDCKVLRGFVLLVLVETSLQHAPQQSHHWGRILWPGQGGCFPAAYLMAQEQKNPFLDILPSHVFSSFPAMDIFFS